MLNGWPGGFSDAPKPGKSSVSTRQPSPFRLSSSMTGSMSCDDDG